MKTNFLLSVSLIPMLMIAKLRIFCLLVFYNGLPIRSSKLSNATMSTTFTYFLRFKAQDNLLSSETSFKSSLEHQLRRQQNEITSIFEDQRQLQIHPEISRIDVIDTLNDRVIITDLAPNTVINLQSYGLVSPLALSFSAVPLTASAVGSIVLQLDTNKITRTESSAPYTLCGEQGSDYLRCSKFTALGNHVIAATAYSGVSATGSVGSVFSRVFSVVLSGSGPVAPPPVKSPATAPIVAPPPVKAPSSAPVKAPVPTSIGSSVSVYSTKTNSAILTLTTGHIIYLGNHGLTSPSQINFVANINTTIYASAVLDLDNKLILRTESLQPFSLCGDKNNGTIFFSCTQLQLGVHTLKVTPYTAIEGKGTAGPVITSSFTIVSGTNGGGPPPTSPIVAPPVGPPTTTRPVAPPPTSTTSCTLPKFVGSWESMKPYPLPLSEAQGTLFGNDFVLISGFTTRYSRVTPKVFALDVSNPTGANWREMTPIPIASGLTHGAFVKVSMDKMYICGGYVGPHPGPATNACFLYEHDKSIGNQWSSFPGLPAQRAGGGMWYDKSRNSLTFAAGASRPDPTRPIYTIDHADTWEIFLNNLGNGWISRAKVPYEGNHVGFTTVLHNGIERHYLAGGQLGEDEFESNLDDLMEWKPSQNQFIRLKNLLEPRGHFSSSVVPYKNCGFLIAGGSIVNSERSDQVSYYDIGKDEWFSIGTLPAGLPTPVCVITNDNSFRCETGFVNKVFSWRISIV